ncbi:MAG TPA: right-handed parallel beta-helix repeat-containing protein [Rhodopseudomonas sp.]|uniref:right-handed parallel beta-helix repeat-containing protein n=1 Tax=Rhodopseudomonas sp. TaxID=1078 RepID=UPI002EDA1CD3
MRKFIHLLSALALLCGLLAAAPAQAQATRTWVSGVGDDANPCSRTAPCKTFAGAISKTAVNGEINCIDPAGYGAVTITKSITIDCNYTLGSILNAGTNGINIPFDSFTAVGETRKTVRLRGLSFNGADTGLIGVRITGAAGSAGSEVFIEHCVIDGNFGGAARGISDERSGGGELYVTDTIVRNTGGTGILVNPNAGASAGSRIDAVLDRARVENSNFGIAVGSAARVMINNSVFAGNTAAGIEAEGPFAAVEVNVDRSVTSGNGTGVANGGGTVTIRLANSDVAFNATGISGVTQSFGNNRISGNGAAGTAPTPIGADSAAKGQQ